MPQTGEGFWINQKNIKNPEDKKDVLKNTIILTYNHINAVSRNFKDEDGYFPFPITREEYNSVYKFYGERFGLEGRARELILLILTCGYGYIRFRVTLKRQEENITFGTGQVDAKTMLIARTLFAYLNTYRNKTISDEQGNGCELRGSQMLNEKGLIFQSYQKLLDSNYTREEREAMFKAVPERHKKVMKKIFGVGRAESSYLKAKADIDYQSENPPKVEPGYISLQRRRAAAEEGNWVYNVAEMLQKFKLSAPDIKKFATDEEYLVLKEYFEKKNGIKNEKRQKRKTN